MTRTKGLAFAAFNLGEDDSRISTRGFFGVEPTGRWTNGNHAQLTLAIEESLTPFLLITMQLNAFLAEQYISEQRVDVSVDDMPVASWYIREDHVQLRVLVIERLRLRKPGEVTIGFVVPTCARPVDFNLNADERSLGIFVRHVTTEGLVEPALSEWMRWEFGRRVGFEASKSYDSRIETGFWSRFIGGPKVLDIGFRGYGDPVLPIVDGAIGIDLSYPGYDGRILPFNNDSQDAVFSSHCLEHIADYVNAIQDWFRVTRPGGHIITIVPSEYLYERSRRPPSRWNDDHKRFYTPSSLLAEFETALIPNTYRVRLLIDNDQDYDYGIPKDQHPVGCYEIVLVIQKIVPPDWELDGG